MQLNDWRNVIDPIYLPAEPEGKGKPLALGSAGLCYFEYRCANFGGSAGSLRNAAPGGTQYVFCSSDDPDGRYHSP